MKMRFLLGFLLLVTACDYFENHKEKQAAPVSESCQLRAAFDVNLVLLQAVSDGATNWPDAIDCDGTLWAGLACASGAPVQINLAEYSPGEIHRRPAPSCYPKMEGLPDSASTVSNDMLTGYLWCLWYRKDLQGLQRLGSYGEENAWVMGKPFPEMAARVVLRGNGISLVGRMIYVLSGGSDDRSYRYTPTVYLPVLEPYEKHLQAQGITLSGQVEEYAREHSLDATPIREFGVLGVNGQELQRLRELVEQEPSNVLFQAALGTYTGDMSEATHLLLTPDNPVPSYVSGNNYRLVHWLKAARLVLDRLPLPPEPCREP